MPDQPETTSALAHARLGINRDMMAPRSQFYQGAFGRLFRNLPAWAPKGDTDARQIEAIFQIAKKSIEPAAFDPALDNDEIPAGYTYFGQFIDHDITFDPTSSLQRRNDPDHLHNFRTPRFDLDNVYGRGPDDQPYLYAQARPDDKPDRQKLLVGANGAITGGAMPKKAEPDLPRNRDASLDDATTDVFSRKRVALIGDPRNDENIIVSQLQLAVIRFHNAQIDAGFNFAEARRRTRWHYQWVVIHDFLKKVCGHDLVDGLFDRDKLGETKLRFYDFRHQPFIPVEFSVAAYRMGHSMVRGKYHLSDRLEKEREGAALDIFKTDSLRDNLQGGRELPPFWTIQWDRFVKFGDTVPQPSRLIDRKLVRQLIELPLPHADEKFRSLPFRNLLRSWRLELPSGQDVARRMGIKHVVEPKQSDPLWIYILKEAEQQGREGRQLGTVGATIVAEVFVGLLAGDPSSYFATDPNWEPKGGRDFDLAAFLNMANAPMNAKDIDDVLGPAPAVPAPPAPVAPVPAPPSP